MVIFTFFSVFVFLAGIGHKRSRGSWQRVDAPQHTDPFFYSCAGARETAQSSPTARAPTRASLTVAPTVASTVASTVANRQQAPVRAGEGRGGRGGGGGGERGVAGGSAVAPIPVVVCLCVDV